MAQDETSAIQQPSAANHPPCACPLDGDFGRRSLLQAPALPDQCANCAANRYYLARLATVFETVNTASTFAGLGALVGYVDQLWTHLSLISIFVWTFTIAIGTAQLDEHTTKPSTRVNTADLFLFLLLFSVLTSIGPLVFISYHFGKELYDVLMSADVVDIWTANSMPPNSVRQVAECESEETLSLAQSALHANANSVFEDCRYENVPVIPTWQSLSISKWTAYGVTISSLTAGVIVWLYGVHCYFARLRCLKRILANGGYINCIPQHLNSTEQVLVNGHIGEPILEQKILKYFTNKDTATPETFEQFLERTISELCRNGQSELVNDLCGQRRNK